MRVSLGITQEPSRDIRHLEGIDHLVSVKIPTVECCTYSFSNLPTLLTSASNLAETILDYSTSLRCFFWRRANRRRCFWFCRNSGVFPTNRTLFVRKTETRWRCFSLFRLQGVLRSRSLLDTSSLFVRRSDLRKFQAVKELLTTSRRSRFQGPRAEGLFLIRWVNRVTAPCHRLFDLGQLFELLACCAIFDTEVIHRNGSGYIRSTFTLTSDLYLLRQLLINICYLIKGDWVKRSIDFTCCRSKSCSHKRLALVLIITIFIFKIRLLLNIVFTTKGFQYKISVTRRPKRTSDDTVLTAHDPHTIRTLLDAKVI